MNRLQSYIIAGILFVLAAGTLSHFLYGWTGNNFIIGLFTPVNESVWEHMKLIFFPMLFYSIFASAKLKADYPYIASSLCFSILIGTLLIPVLFYAYTYILGKNFLVLDIIIFALSTALAFFTVYKLTISCRFRFHSILLYCLTGILLNTVYLSASGNGNIYRLHQCHGLNIKSFPDITEQKNFNYKKVSGFFIFPNTFSFSLFIFF